jgi:hypothetical protein
MTQKARVLSMLRNAGERGVRSDEFIRSYMPRAAARVQDLKDEGVEITSEREGKFCRYRLVDHHAVSDGSVTSSEYPQGESVAELSESHRSGGLPTLFDVPPRSAFTDDEMAA